MLPIYESKTDRLYVHNTQGVQFPAHLHEHLELFYLLEGTNAMTVDGVPRLLQAGDLAVVFPNVIHEYECGQERSEIRGIMVICNPELFGDYMNALTAGRPSEPYIGADRLHADVPYALRSLLAQREEDVRNMAASRAYIQLILSRVLPCLQLVSAQDDRRMDLTGRVVSYIARNFAQPLSLDILSRQMGVSRTHLSRVFSHKLRTSFPDYLSRIRINAAQNLLRGTKAGILEIALECGFDNQRTFNRAFRAVSGTSPREFRKGSHQR